MPSKSYYVCSHCRRIFNEKNPQWHQNQRLQWCHHCSDGSVGGKVLTSDPPEEDEEPVIISAPVMPEAITLRQFRDLNAGMSIAEQNSVLRGLGVQAANRTIANNFCPPASSIALGRQALNQNYAEALRMQATMSQRAHEQQDAMMIAVGLAQRQGFPYPAGPPIRPDDIDPRHIKMSRHCQHCNSSYQRKIAELRSENDGMSLKDNIRALQKEKLIRTLKLKQTRDTIIIALTTGTLLLLLVIKMLGLASIF